MTLQRLFAAFATVLLAACGTVENRAGIDRVDAAALSSDRSGVIILSTGAATDCYSYATFIRIIDQATSAAVRNVPLVPVDSSFGKSDFSDHRGTVNAIVLPPGKYFLSPWLSNPYYIATKTPLFPFEVFAGETTYLGEMFMPRSCSLSNTFAFSDRYARDIALASAKNPAIAGRAPVKRLIGLDERTGQAQPVPPIDALPSVPAPVPAVQSWDGTMACKARQDSGPNSGAYEVKFAMEQRGSAVTVSRKTADVSEILTGQVDNRRLELRGKGYRIGDPSRRWEFIMSGDFPSGASNYIASGNMRADGRSIRACELKMTRSI